MTVQEILNATQVLTYEERRKLIQGLVVQMPQAGGLAGTITEVNDFDAGKHVLRQSVAQSVERTAQDLNSESGAATNGTVEGFDPLRRREYEWINQHRNEYAGRYVALVGGQLVADAATLRELHKLVRATNAHRPFFARIEAKDELPSGGW